METEPAYGFSIGVFNASLAKLWAPATDLLFSTGFSGFMSDSTRAVDITEAKYRKSCSQDHSSCKSAFYVPGGIEVSVQWDLESSGSTKSDVYLALDQQGYVFEFARDTQGWTYNTSEECHAYGFGEFVCSLCLKNGIDQAVQTRRH